ncbi:MAG: MoxR family ATPase [Deltaproteobacteria bacterium]|nr:MAG: MoxR family ATPase [Deltaproteobacteria bacterium]
MTDPLRAPVVRVVDILADRYLQGKIQTIKLAMTSLLAGGHLLLEDIPGLGKTTVALALARALGLSFGRIQCTSDLLPSDITGLSILDRTRNEFRFLPGPIFSNLVLADEINRAMPRTQSALLEAMEERRVTVEGTTYPLPEPFMVIATQNPVEQVGTYPLPESQLDRFLVTTGIGYPPAAMEKAIIQAGSIRDDILEITPLLTVEELQAARAAVRRDVHLSPKIVDYVYRLTAATREHRLLATGISTRGAIGLADTARAGAFLAGRDHVLPEDVKALFIPVCAHRVILRPEHEALDRKEILQSLLDTTPVPLA